MNKPATNMRIKNVARASHGKGNVTERVSRGELWMLIGLCLAGLLLRVLFLGRASYMIDEINVIRDALSGDGFISLYNAELDRFTWYHRLPLLMFILHAVIGKAVNLAGSFPSEWLSRLPFALVGTASLPLFYFLGRRIRGHVMGMWAMFLAAFSIYHVYYSRETYDYILVVFFAIGVMWTSIGLLDHWLKQRQLSLPMAAGYIFFSTGFLYAHLTSLLFLGTWNVVIALAVILGAGWRDFWKPRLVCFWAITLGTAYILFLPFLLKLLGGYKTTDSLPVPLSLLEAILTVLGRMGWGQAVWTLVPFTFFVALGITAGIQGLRTKKENTIVLVAIQAVLYFLIQFIMLKRTHSSLQLKYFTPLFPLLILCAAAGITTFVSRLSSFLPRIRAVYLHGFIALILLAWLCPSLWLVMTLKCRGCPYKGIATWINQNLPVNGIYSYMNIYELRGVPDCYPTPRRYGTFPAAFSTLEDYKKNQVKKRLTAFFLRFPLAAYVEIYPTDLLGSASDKKSMEGQMISREMLFTSHEWLEDDAYQLLLKRKVHPQGGAIKYPNTVLDRVLISYNLVQDLPRLAAKRGQKVFHYFGQDCGYVKDRQWNDWSKINRRGTLYIHNITDQPLKTELKIRALAAPSACFFSLTDSRGNVLIDKMSVSTTALQEITVQQIVLPPGLNRFLVEILPASGSVASELFIHSSEIRQL